VLLIIVVFREECLGRVKIGGYLIEWWIGDHWPKHIHIYKDGKQVAKVRIPEMIVLTGRLNKKLRKIIQILIKEKGI
jgi:hypothetical protein